MAPIKTALCSLLLLGLQQSASALRFSSNGTTPPYKNPNNPVEVRVEDLLGRMTIEDKMAQLMQGDIGNWMDEDTGAFNYTGLVDNMNLKAGSFYVGYPVPWDWISTNVKRAQDYLIQNTTLGIPALVQTEGIHGFLIGNATIFNSPIAHGCSFNPDLIEKMAEVIAEESLALGVNQLFAPVTDLARELRFGRVEEMFAEDAYLSGEMSYSYVKGVQAHNVSAMVKHFIAFSNPEQGLNTGPVHGGERELRTTWLPAAKRAIMDAGAWSIMSSYNSYDGVPQVADYHTLTEILRDEWGYEYFVMSDAGGTDRLCTHFKTCRAEPIDKESVTLQALPAGNDVEMGGGSFNFESIPDLVDAGTLDIEVVDTAVERLLRAKFEMGLFEQPYRGLPEDEQDSVIHTEEAVKLARELDRESIVLLENHNSTLPLDKSANIAVIGPMAHGYMNYGDYVVHKSQFRGVTPLDGIRSAVGDSATVNYAQGCERWSNDQSGFEEAIEAAEKSDVAVVVVGTWSRDQYELWQGLNATTGEHVDVNDLNLVGAQAPLVKAIRDTGVPTVVVFSSGKPVTEPWISNSTSALIQQFYPSEEGGNALADILFGDYNPSGRLSVSFPHTVGALPIYYDYLNSGRESDDFGSIQPDGSIVFGHQYVIGDPNPWYEFGYGKSYSTFTYSNSEIDVSEISVSDIDQDAAVTVSVDVTNESDVDGMEVVQVYVSDVISSVVVPNKTLRGFEKVFIPAGETETVEIEVKISELGLYDSRMRYVVEPGEFKFMVSASSRDVRGTVSLEVVR